MSKQTLKKHISLVGREEVSNWLNVSISAVSNAANRGKLPPSWYFSLKEMYEDRGLTPIPRKFFNFVKLEEPAE
jgi:hypothetical protein